MKAKFKDTEIGMIPEDWEVKRLCVNVTTLMLLCHYVILNDKHNSWDIMGHPSSTDKGAGIGK